ncbi:ferrous iron transporter B [Silanimonas lenta]|uniref:ferrous iron transporter B n=1 Tax=Silanimonas lenta TaxID=265429 RepID=UPI000403D09B|nr:ferrous iron transporter B [Silanimonas lenta]
MDCAVTPSTAARPRRVALVGNPNAGKTALFNRLTGSRQKVANYAGVTVERKEGRLRLPSGQELLLLDLPGSYSLRPASLDEAVTRDLLRGMYPGEPAPDAIVCVVDATHLRLHLRFVLELRALGRPMLVALNQMDAARRRGLRIDLARLAAELGVPVLPTVAVRRGGADALVDALETGRACVPALPPPADEAAAHAEVQRLLAAAVEAPEDSMSLEDRLDRWLLHPLFGYLIFALLMFFVFQAVYAWAEPLVAGIEAATAWAGEGVAAWMPEGPLRSLLVDGVFSGLGAVLVFLPQILILFLFILVLEESGYLPRAAFLLDRPMRAAGLSGRSFIPLLSSFACAVPGIMATRSIQDPRDRFATQLVAPLMTCSARLPVYALLIGAFIPRRDLPGGLKLQGLVLFGLYLAGILSALAVAWFSKRWRRDRREAALLLELPAYRWPHPRDLALGLAERATIFLRRVGGILLALTVLLWFLASYPAPPEGAATAIDHSFAGRIGHFIAPLFAPLGFPWQVCVALVPAMAAREVAVSALATVYALSATDADAAGALAPLIAHDWSLATALALLVWFIYAPQCISTLATLRRETGSWRKTAFAAGYLFALAYLAALLTYQLAVALGAG